MIEYPKDTMRNSTVEQLLLMHPEIATQVAELVEAKYNHVVLRCNKEVTQYAVTHRRVQDNKIIDQYRTLIVTDDVRDTIEEILIESDNKTTKKLMKYLANAFMNEEIEKISLAEALAQTRRRVVRMASKYLENHISERLHDEYVTFEVIDYLHDVDGMREEGLRYVVYSARIGYDGDAGKHLIDRNIKAHYVGGYEFEVWNVFDYGTAHSDIYDKHKKSIDVILSHYGQYIRM